MNMLTYGFLGPFDHWPEYFNMMLFFRPGCLLSNIIFLRIYFLEALFFKDYLQNKNTLIRLCISVNIGPSLLNIWLCIHSDITISTSVLIKTCTESVQSGWWDNVSNRFKAVGNTMFGFHPNKLLHYYF